jgi:hypothetical protein
MEYKDHLLCLALVNDFTIQQANEALEKTAGRKKRVSDEEFLKILSGNAANRPPSEERVDDDVEDEGEPMQTGSNSPLRVGHSAMQSGPSNPTRARDSRTQPGPSSSPPTRANHSVISIIDQRLVDNN